MRCGSEGVGASDMTERDWRHGSRDRLPLVLGGLTIVALGVVLQLGELGVIDVRGGWRAWWPLLLIGMGVARLASSPHRGERDGGGLVVIGGWLLLNQLRILEYRTSWPLLLVGVGVSIVFKALTGASGLPPGQAGDRRL